MYETFTLDLTPAIARRLVRLARKLPLDLDPEVYRAAEQDLIDFDADARTKEFGRRERDATQFLLDCGLRAVIAAEGGIDERVVPLAMALAGVQRAVIITDRTQATWTRAFSGFDLDRTIHDAERVFDARCRAEEIPDIDDQGNDTVQIVDLAMIRVTVNRSMICRRAMEYPHTIIFDRGKGAPTQPTFAGRMFTSLARKATFARPYPQKWRESASCLHPSLTPFFDNFKRRHVGDDATGRRLAMPETYGVGAETDLALFFNVYLADAFS